MNSGLFYVKANSRTIDLMQVRRALIRAWCYSTIGY